MGYGLLSLFLLMLAFLTAGLNSGVPAILGPS